MRPLLLTWLLACAPTDRGRGHGPNADSGLVGTGLSAGTAAGTPAGTGVPEPSLALGNGENFHVETLPGDDVFIVLGGQGGWHVDISGQTWQLDDIVAIDVWVEQDDGSRLAESEATRNVQLAGYDSVEKTGWFAGSRAFLELGAVADLCPMVGQPLVICASVVELKAEGLPTVGVEGCVRGVANMNPEDLALCP